MKEIVLKKFFEGQADAATLAADLLGAVQIQGTTKYHHIEDMEDDFEIRAEHLVRLCDVVLMGDLDPKDLETIGFCLLASDAFYWDTDVGDGDVISKTCFDWSEPRINYPLTHENVVKFRERLLTGENVFAVTEIAQYEE